MTRRPLRIAPSILAADLGRLREEAQSLERAGADWIHVDIMDGHFVPNLTFGPGIVSALRDAVSLPLDCHLMVSRPADWIDPVIDAGADRVTVHIESTPHIHRALARIRARGAAPGISVNPGHTVSAVEAMLDWVDTVQVMSVDPGFSGQSFLAPSLRFVRALRDRRGTREYLIEIDGGISPDNIGHACEAGADVFVVGSSLFRLADRAEGLRRIREEAARCGAASPRRQEAPPAEAGTIAIASDHAGFDLKEHLLGFLRANGFEVIDLGTHSREPSDYPDFAEKLGSAILGGRAGRGILLCGSGVGAAVAACKIPGIRAGVCHDSYSAHQGVEHDDMNVLVLGARVVGAMLAEDLVSTYLRARFDRASRHLRRLEKVAELERKLWGKTA